MSQPINQFFDPSQLEKAEQVPAKIWELLRRNRGFQLAFNRLKRLVTTAGGKRKESVSSNAALMESRSFIEVHRSTNPFAGCALEWLVPGPLFIRNHVKLPAGSEGKAWSALEFGRIDEGRFIDGEEQIHWRSFENRRGANLAGRRMTRGPMLRWMTCDDPRIADSFDPAIEWQEYAKKHGLFRLRDSWAVAPPGFKRAFQNLWSEFDSRAGSRPSHETSFFQGWRLEELVNRGSREIEQANKWLRNPPQLQATKFGQMTTVPQARADFVTVEDRAKLLRFDDLARNYRVFAVSRSLLTKGVVRSAFKSLAEEVAKNLPDEHQLFGTTGQWEDFLAIESFQKKRRVTRQKAIQLHLQSRYAGQRTLTEALQASGGDVAGRVAQVESLRDGICPDFDLGVLLKPASHRRSRKPRKAK